MSSQSQLKKKEDSERVVGRVVDGVRLKVRGVISSEMSYEVLVVTIAYPCLSIGWHIGRRSQQKRVCLVPVPEIMKFEIKLKSYDALMSNRGSGTKIRTLP